MRAWLLTFFLASVALAQPTNPWLEEGRLLAEQLRFADAIERLQVARDVPGLDPAQRRAVLELLARCQVAEGHRADANATFAELLKAEPDFELDRASTSPKILDAFDEAKKALYPPSFVQLLEQPSPAGQVTLQLVDPWHKASTVRAFTRVDEGPWEQHELSLDHGRVSLPVVVPAGSTLDWYAEVLGEATPLASLGTAEHPQHVVAAKVEVVATTVPAASKVRPVAWVLAGVGVAALIAATVLQVNGWGLRQAARDPSKAPGNWADTALAADHSGLVQTQVALGLFIAGGVVAATGGVLFAW